MSDAKKIGHIRVLLGYLGIFLAIVGVLALLPLVILPFYSNEARSTWPTFVITGVSCLAVGSLLYQLIRGKQNLLTVKNQDAIIVVLSWTIALFVSAIPFMTISKLNFWAALFESGSAWSTTGMTMLDVANTPHILMFYRSLTTLAGGVGIILIMLLVFSNKKGMRLYSSDGHGDKLLPNLLKSSKVILEIYLGYIAAGIILFMCFGMNLYDAIIHSINCVSTSGFSNHPESFAYFNNLGVEIIGMILMLLGATNFFIQFLLFNGKLKNFLKYCETKANAFIFGICVPIMLALVIHGFSYSVPTAIRFTLFHFVSAITTTGFTIMNVNWNTIGPAFVILLLVIMTIGGESGSTAGGIKAYRVHILARDFSWNIKQKTTPDNVISLDFAQKAEDVEVIDAKEKNSVKSYVLLYLIILFILAFIICLFGYSVKESLFDTASAFSSTGYAMGVFSASSHPIVLLCGVVAMMLGRVEIIIIFVAASQIGKNIVHRIRKIRRKS